MAEPTYVPCPNCGHPYPMTAMQKELYRGRTLSCNNCAKPFSADNLTPVPMPAARPWAPAAESAPAPAPPVRGAPESAAPPPRKMRGGALVVRLRRGRIEHQRADGQRADHGRALRAADQPRRREQRALCRRQRRLPPPGRRAVDDRHVPCRGDATRDAAGTVKVSRRGASNAVRHVRHAPESAGLLGKFALEILPEHPFDAAAEQADAGAVAVAVSHLFVGEAAAV